MTVHERCGCGYTNTRIIENGKNDTKEAAIICDECQSSDGATYQDRPHWHAERPVVGYRPAVLSGKPAKPKVGQIIPLPTAGRRSK